MKADRRSIRPTRMPNSSSAGVVFVTGASGGIGSATILALHRRGVSVVGGARDGRSSAPAPHSMITLDLQDLDSIGSAPGRCKDLAGGAPIRGLVCLAGVTAFGSVEGTSQEVFGQILEVNVSGTAAVCQAFLPGLRATGGRIVIVGSLSGRSPQPFQAAYAASKAALAAWGDALREEVRPLGIEVIVVEPGGVSTGMAGGLEIPLTDMDSTSPYHNAALSRRRAILRGVESGIAPERVAEAITSALLDPRPPRRIVLDARPIRSALRRIWAARGRAIRPKGSNRRRALGRIGRSGFTGRSE